MATGCNSQEQKPIAKHVVMIGLDGLAGNCVECAEMPTLKHMMSQGAWTLQARSILPSSSACNWASVYMGVGPEMHGYNTWGSRTPDFPSIELCDHGIMPTIFTALRNHNSEYNLCALYEWEVHGDLIDSKSVTYNQYIPMGEDRGEAITNAYAEYLKEHKPTFSTCIFNSPDVEGHDHGWGSETYMDRLKSLDSQIATIVEERCKENGVRYRAIPISNYETRDPQVSFNLPSAMHHCCGTPCVTFESNQGLCDHGNVIYDFDEIYESHMIYMTEVFRYYLKKFGKI